MPDIGCMIAWYVRVLAPIAAVTSLSGAVVAAPGPIGAETRLRTCGSDVCLVVTGSRPDAAAAVSLGGHDVAVRGGRSWRATVPLDTLRAWSAPFARSIHVAIAGPGGGEADARLPIGLLGQPAELAFLDVRAGH